MLEEVTSNVETIKRSVVSAVIGEQEFCFTRTTVSGSVIRLDMYASLWSSVLTYFHFRPVISYLLERCCLCDVAKQDLHSKRSIVSIDSFRCHFLTRNPRLVYIETSLAR